MKINSKIRYGLRTMLELALNVEEKGMLQKDIAERQDIPVKYLDQIISALKSAGLITNVSGKKSGYRLVRQSSEISIYDIYRAFEGNLSIIHCLNETGICKRGEACACKNFWQGLNLSIEQYLGSHTLETIVQQQKEIDLNESKSIVFEI